jgi:hypothetical protein
MPYKFNPFTGSLDETGATGTVSAAGPGTAAAPSISFAGDTDTGIFSPGADTLAFAEGGAEAMRLTSAGLLGLGTTSPQTALDIEGSLPFLTIRGLGTGEHGLQIRSGANPGTNVGGLTYNSSTGELKLAGPQNYNFWTVYTNNAERARIDSSGRLLVGTSSARSNLYAGALSAALQVEGTTYNTSSLSMIANGSSSALNPYPIFYLGRSRGASVNSNTIVASADNIGSIIFTGADGTNLVPAAAIECFVDGTPGTNDMPGRLIFSTTADGAATPTEAMRIKSTGIINFSNAPTHADNTAATAAGLAVGDVYKTVLGVLMIRF